MLEVSVLSVKVSLRCALGVLLLSLSWRSMFVVAVVASADLCTECGMCGWSLHRELGVFLCTYMLCLPCTPLHFVTTCGVTRVL